MGIVSQYGEDVTSGIDKAIVDKIGLTPLTTTAKDLSGAVNELDSEISALDQEVDAASSAITTLQSNVTSITTDLHATREWIASPYDSTRTYEVDDLAIYENELYKCVTAVTVPEAFDENKWQGTGISYEMSQHDSKLRQHDSEISALNSSLNTFKRVDITTSTASFPSTISIYGSTYYEKIGRLVVVVVNLKIESSSKTRHTITNFIPTYNDRPEYAKSFMAGDGDVDGLGQGFSIEADGRLTLYNTKTGTSYCQGTAIYISRG